ncbi:hypothetical protein ABPG72_009394 [Tetrahymena utriculariae]
MRQIIQSKGLSHHIANPLFEELKSFQIQDLYQILKNSKRDLLYSILIFSFHQLVLIQLQIDDNTYQDLISSQKVFSQFIGYFFFLKEFSINSVDQSKLNTAVQIFSVIYCLIVFFLLINFIFRSRIKKYYISTFSLVLQSYEYLIALPSLYISLSDYQYYVAFFNIILTIFIGSLIISLDYSYSFQDEDILDKCDSHLNPTLFYQDLVAYISSCFFNIYEDILFLSAIILFPLSYKIGNLVFLSYYGYVNLQIASQDGQYQEISLFKFILNDSNKKIDILCRLLFEGIKERLHFSSQIANSIFIFAKQIIGLEKQADSQEAQGQDDHDNKLNNKRGISKILQKQMQKFSVKDILNDSCNIQSMKNTLSIYQENLKSKKISNCLNELHFSYLTFLSTLSLNSCQSYIQILNVKSNQKILLGLKDQQKMQQIMKQAEIQSQLNPNKMKKEEEFQLYLILQFEDEINKLQQQYFQCLRQYKAAVEKLSMSFIEINEIILILKEYRDDRNKLEASIINQLQMNSQSESLKNLCINFDFYMLHKQSLLKFYENQNRQQIQEMKRKDYYSKHSCLIYISLLERSLGTIQKANRAFVKAFGFKNKQQVLGKPIQSILPDAFLKRSSEAALSQIISEEFLSLYNETLDMPLLQLKTLLVILSHSS